MNTHESYVSLETAKLLKRAGFNWECRFYYSVLVDAPESAGILDDETKYVYGLFDTCICGEGNSVGDVLAPSLSFAQKWIREVKHCSIEVVSRIEKDNEVWYGVKFMELTPQEGRFCMPLSVEFSHLQPLTYEQALEEGIKLYLKWLWKMSLYLDEFIEPRDKRHWNPSFEGIVMNILKRHNVIAKNLIDFLKFNMMD